MSLKRQFLWSMMPLLVVSVVNVFSVPLFLRYLGEEMYALWFYVNVVTGMFGFADLGLGVAVGRYIGVAIGKGDHAAVKEYWGTGNLIALPLLMLMAVVFVIAGWFWGAAWFKVSPQDVSLLRACFAVGGACLFLNFYSQIWNILLQTQLDFKFSSLLRVSVSLLLVIPGLFIAYATRSPLWINVWALVVAVFQLVALMGYSRRRYGFGVELTHARRSRAWEMAPYTGKTFASLIAGSFLGSIDRVLLGNLAPAAQFAYYSVCTNIGSRLHGLGGSVMGPVFHNTTRAVGSGRQTSASTIYNEMFNFMFGWYVLSVVWSVVWGPVFLRLWLDVFTGKNISEQIAPIFAPLIAAFCIMALSSIASAQLGPLDRAGTALILNIVAGLAAAAGVYLGWRWGGIVGVAWGFLASRGVLILQDLFVIRLIQAQGWLSIQNWMAVAAQVLVGAAFAGFYLIFPRHSLWLIFPAVLHGTLVAIWLVRHQVRHRLEQYFSRSPAIPPVNP